MLLCEVFECSFTEISTKNWKKGCCCCFVRVLRLKISLYNKPGVCVLVMRAAAVVVVEGIFQKMVLNVSVETAHPYAKNLNRKK